MSQVHILLPNFISRIYTLAYLSRNKFHSLQKFKNISYTDKLKNKLDYKFLPINSVAIYVPGSTASYPSTVLMNAIPAIVAGVKRIIMINPGFKGKQNPGVLYAAKNAILKKSILLVDLQLLQQLLMELKRLSQ